MSLILSFNVTNCFNHFYIKYIFLIKFKELILKQSNRKMFVINGDKVIETSTSNNHSKVTSYSLDEYNYRKNNPNSKYETPEQRLAKERIKSRKENKKLEKQNSKKEQQNARRIPLFLERHVSTLSMV